MSRIRSLRARLDRLAPRAIKQNADSIPEFTIDPAVAKALRDDYERLNELCRKNFHMPVNLEEESILCARIADRARAIECPAGYGAKEREEDEDRLSKFFYKRISPRGSLSAAEDAEEAQLRARVAAFDETPEGRGRQRIRQLWLSGPPLSTAEKDEFDRLKRLYPPLPVDPHDPRLRLFKEIEAYVDTLEEGDLKRVLMGSRNGEDAGGSV
jgi:hypothetical protein